MEYEIRYYYNNSELNKIMELLKKQMNLEYKGRFYEKTIQLDHPNNENTFYSKQIDGRFRIRVSKLNDDIRYGKITWKRRLNNIEKNEINIEEEVEVDFDYNQYDNLMFLLKNVLQMKQIESYERYRNVFSNNDIEIVVDEYPFGIALEIESKTKNKDYKQVILNWLDILNLDYKNAYRLSWDDKYKELCDKQNIIQHTNVTFNKQMPQIEDLYFN